MSETSRPSRRREPAAPKPPFWHRSRLGWVNAFGFALSAMLGLGFLLTALRALLPGAEAGTSSIPTAYIAVSVLALLATVVLCGIVVFRFAWRGADFHDPVPHTYVLLWTYSGLLFFVIQALILVRFGAQPMPHVAAWVTDTFWFVAPFGLACFALMLYVNAGVNPAPEEEYDEEHGEYEGYDEHDEYEESYTR